MVDGLGRLMHKAGSLEVVKYFKNGREQVQISHLQFAGDTPFIPEPWGDNVRNLAAILKFFSHCSGLRINMGKSTLYGINVEEFIWNLALEWVVKWVHGL